MSALGIPVDVEKSNISIDLNSSTLLAFLMGIYTVVYFETIYVYFAKGSSKRRLIPAAITVLYVTSIVQTGIQWYTTKWLFVNNGDTRDSVFLALYDGPQWLYLAVNIPSYIGFVLVDGLLIWRCFLVWNSSFRAISLPLLLVIAEAGLFFVQIVLHGIYGGFPVSQALSIRFNRLLAAAYLTSSVTTLFTTILIAYRIYSGSKQAGIATGRFKQVIDIVVQSGAVYSVSLLVTAISVAMLGTGSVFTTQTTAFMAYMQYLNVCISGMSATIMVARVALLTPDTTFSSTSANLSGLQFRTHSTSHTDTAEEAAIACSINLDRISVDEGKVEHKVQ